MRRQLQQMRMAKTGVPEYDLLVAIIERAALDAEGEGKTAVEAADWLASVLGQLRHWRQKQRLRERWDG